MHALPYEMLKSLRGDIDIVIAGCEERNRVLPAGIGCGLKLSGRVNFRNGHLGAGDGSARWVCHRAADGTSELLSETVERKDSERCSHCSERTGKLHFKPLKD